MFPEFRASFEKVDVDFSDPVAHMMHHRSSFELEGCLESPSLLSEAQFCGLSELARDPDSFVASVEVKFNEWLGKKADLAPSREQWLRSLPERKKRVGGCLDLFIMRTMLLSFGHRDIYVVC